MEVEQQRNRPEYVILVVGCILGLANYLFDRKMTQTPQWSLGQNVSAYHLLVPLDLVLPLSKSSEVGHLG